ncbi:hypothetical protein B0T25DRAFT_631833 [Lasiosphaeria hispida]|uniref:Uncharacterized protein n=1 Tax=Lasiosphaeria hispida TaxID=260671 RepID=A0AAJ0HIN6_9PEZI|nr:hypothetical protein B0T25DRAFT_631833 [Lasiosphaeria hispida]
MASQPLTPAPPGRPNDGLLSAEKFPNDFPGPPTSLELGINLTTHREGAMEFIDVYCEATAAETTPAASEGEQNRSDELPATPHAPANRGGAASRPRRRLKNWRPIVARDRLQIDLVLMNNILDILIGNAKRAFVQAIRLTSITMAVNLDQIYFWPPARFPSLSGILNGFVALSIGFTLYAGSLWSLAWWCRTTVGSVRRKLDSQKLDRADRLELDGWRWHVVEWFADSI